jgi:dipeptidyl aminopeptidase/acylaminoacyl peptidase
MLDGSGRRIARYGGRCLRRSCLATAVRAVFGPGAAAFAVGVTLLAAHAAGPAWGRSAAVAVNRAATDMTSQLPPLIDREQFFGDPEISGAQISPDGRFIAFLKPFNGTRNIWVKAVAESFDKARPLTADTKRPITSYFWSRDAKFILYVQDEGGDENFNVHAVSPSEMPPAGADAPVVRNITDAKGVRAEIFAVPKSDPDVIFVGLNDRDQAWHDLYRVKISTGERTLVLENTERLLSYVFDLRDRLRLVTRSAENGDTEVLRVDDANAFTKIYSCNVFESCAPVRFHKDGRRVYMETNRGEVDLVCLTLLDVDSGHEQLVEVDPLGRVDLAAADFSERNDELIVTIYVDAKPRYYWKDKEFEADYELLKRKLRDREISIASSTLDETLLLVTGSSDVEPGETYLFDRRTKELTFQYRVRENLPRESLASMKPVSYASSDGLEIPAYLTLPKGAAPGNLPAMLLPHGGPWARDVWGYNPFAQFLANRGYAVLMPNFRSSTGYGKRFLDAGNRQWGDRMQDDLTWGVKLLVEQGIADPKRIGIMGGSYGGYATLAGVAFTPHLYAAAVSIVGPSNLITLMDSIPPYWEAARKLFEVRMGDLSSPDGRRQLERQSPLNSASKIVTPLLVIQGANDPRVNKRESDQIVVALRDRGFPVEYIVAPDEGHGFARPVNNIAAYASAEKFLARYLGGRYQDTMTAEVAARLEQIRVDPSTVTVVKKQDPGAVGLPKPAVPLRPGTFTYETTIEGEGQSVQTQVTTRVEESDDGWVVSDVAATPQGTVTDRTLLDKQTLALRRRSVSQGAVTLEIVAGDGKVTGEMKMAGEVHPFSADTGGDLFADGAGGHQAIATLPLAPGYTTSFRNLNVQTLKVRVVRLQVAGTEQITVPAGTFEAFRVELTPEDGGSTTLWIAKDSRKVVRSVSMSPATGGARITSELQK